jgi:hypothetical protein
MGLVLGKSRRGSIGLTPEERSWHVQVLGGSGRGKSYLLESLIRQDILAGRGLCLIDPHGTLADQVVEWCASRRMNDYRLVHLIDASDLDWSASFNPLRMDGVSDPSVRVDAMVAACAQVWGGEDTNRTPLLRKCLTAVFYALAVRGLTLVEATELISSVDAHRVRRTLTEGLPDHVFDTIWQDFNGLRRAEFVEYFSSTNSRLNLFLKSPAVRRILGQTNRALDLKEVMDRGEVLIVNLAPKNRLSHENTRLLGTLLTSELFLLAVARDAAVARRRPFTLYVDEAADFITDDIERMLDQTRKFGLHVVLAHQRLSQLSDRSERIYNAVKDGTHTKVVFGGLSDNDAEVMAKELFRSTFSLSRPKHVLDKPIVVEEVPYWLESESHTEGSSITTTEGGTSGWQSTTGDSEGLSEQFGPDINQVDPDGRMTSKGRSSSEARHGSDHFSTGETRSQSSSWGRSQTLKPLRVTMPTAVHTLEEELHLAIVRLRTLPKQAAILKRPNGMPVRFRPLTIAQTASGKARATAFIAAARASSPFIAPAEIAEAEMAARLAGLRRPAAVPSDDEFFVEETR